MQNDKRHTSRVKAAVILSLVYGFLWLIPSVFGVVLSIGAQPGGISQWNAFVASLLGPWSPILSPNPSPMSQWTPRYTAFAQCLTAILLFSLAGSYLAREREVKYGAAALSCLGLAIWVLAGLAKVVLEMT